ncbi:MAG: InlB B-repeat-containing protein [Deltaproteobacteria bacterium]|nr:InlB B-repeat-containing protein [Deltaproteobacteria bacterium]
MTRGLSTLALLTIGSGVCGGTAHAATHTVTTTGDSGPGSLRQAVADAAAGDTVLVTVSGTITLTSGGILVDKNLTITGPGSANLTVSGNDAAIVFGFEQAITASLTGITVADGRAASAGGGILTGATLVLTDVVVQNSAADAGGGGIYNTATGNLRLVNTRVTGNTATGFGGGILSAGPLTLTTSVVSNNSAAQGGGLDVSANTVVTDSVISGNSAVDGAGIASTASMTLNGSQISGNQATGNGGGLKSSGSFSINPATTISGNRAQQGGGIYMANTVYGAFATMTFGTITGNTATQVGGGITNVNGWLIVGGTVSNNSATDGAGIYHNTGYLAADSLTLSGNTASGTGGGLYVWGEMKEPRDVALIKCTISGNSARGGGGIFTNLGKIEVSASTISGNTAAVNGGGVFSYDVFSVVDSTISGNSAEVGGGIRGTLVGTSAQNTILADNTATGGGPDCRGTLVSNDYNLIGNTADCTITGTTTHDVYGQAPLLGPLQDNGGLTLTRSLLAGSPAINAGSCLNNDQRGIVRPQNGACDIGAVELTWPELSDLVTPPGNALDFDGTNDHVSIPDATALDLSTSYTVEAWIKPAAFMWLAGIVSKYHSPSANGYTLRLGASGNYDGINFDGMETAGGILHPGRWQHVAAVYDGAARHVYVNGLEHALTGTSFVPAANTDPVMIGSDFNNRFFAGAIDEVRIWSTARSQAEILASAFTTVAYDESGLVAYYRFDEGVAGGDNAARTTLKGQTSPSAQDGTLNNFALSGASSNWVASGAMTLLWYVTPSAGSGGSISPSTVQAVANNQTASFTITADDGYGVDVVTGCTGTLSGRTYTCSTGPVTADGEVTASFVAVVNGQCGADDGAALTATPVDLCGAGTASAVAGSGPWSWTCAGQYGGSTASCLADIRSYALTFQSGGNGTVTGVTSQTVVHGGDASEVGAVAAAGFHFVDWTGTNGFVTTVANPLVVTNVTAAMEITANFVHDRVDGACGADHGQTLGTTSPTNLCSAGIASAAAGLGPWTWTCEGQYGGATADCSAAIQTYAVTFQSDGNGTITGTTSQTVNHGGDASEVQAWAAAGYHFVEWTGTNGFVTTLANPLVVTGVTAAMVITASFAHDNVNGACGADHGQTLAGTTPTSLCSSGVSSAVAGSGPWSWTCAGQYGGSTANCSASIQTYGVTFLSDGNGTIAGETSQTVNHGGDAAEIEALAAAGYHFVEWTGTSGFVTTLANPLVVTNVTAAMVITANFAHDSVNGACGADHGQTLAGTTPMSLCSSGVSSAVAGSGPWSWTCAGQYGGSTANCSANIQTYGVTFLSDGNGTITGATSQTVNHGGSTTQVTATANSGYHFLNWTGTNGFVATVLNPLILDNVVSSHTITANFSADAVDGACGTASSALHTEAPASDLCATGVASTVSGAGPWTWTCTGLNGGTTADCLADELVAVPDGDLNGDGRVDNADGLKALRIASGLDVASPTDLARGDVAPLVGGTPASDGVIDTGDVVVILRRAAGLVTW